MILKLCTAFAILLCIRGACAQEILPLYPREIPNSIAAPDEEKVRDPKETFSFLMNTSRPTTKPSTWRTACDSSRRCRCRKSQPRCISIRMAGTDSD